MNKKKALLHEILAIEPEVKGNAERGRSRAIDTFRTKQNHFNGMRRTFRPFAVEEENAADAGERLEAETHLVSTVIEELQQSLEGAADSIDLGLAIDNANTRARADIVVNDEVLASDVPATFLLQLEKRLKEVRTVLKEVPCYDPVRIWSEDKSADRRHVLRAEPVVTIRKQRNRKYNVMYEATKEHPAQVDVMEVDEPVGEIRSYDWTGMISPGQKTQLLEQMDKLMQAVKSARSRANAVEVDRQRVASKLFDFVMRPCQ